MSKHRVVKSDFWVDQYVESLQVKERYFFLYLLTNPNTNILGIYQTTVKRMMFETSLDDTTIESMLRKFAQDDKVHFVASHILMVNFQRHQNPSGTMKTGIKKLIAALPKEVVDFIYSEKSVIFDSLSYLMIDYAYPYKDIDKNKGKSKSKNKPRKSKFNPLENRQEFIDNIPEKTKSEYSLEYLERITDDIIDYCERAGKTYNDYYAAMRTFIKNDDKQSAGSGTREDKEFDEQLKHMMS